MKILLAYAETYNNARDLLTGLKSTQYPLITFELEVSALPTASETGVAFTSDLADGSKFQLFTRKRKKQQITTMPDLLLTTVRMTKGKDKGKTLTLKELLSRWYWAHGQWIYTGAYDITSASVPLQNLVKVVRSSDELAFNLLNGIRWAVSATFAIEAEGAE